MLSLAGKYLADKLEKQIVGQRKALEEVATAICDNFEAFSEGEERKRNNILLSGSTGSGKTEIARRLSDLLGITFVRVAASDFTLPGYKGRDPQEIVTVDFRERITQRHYDNIKTMVTKYRLHKAIAEILKKLELNNIEYYITLEFLAVNVFFSEEESRELILDRLGKDKHITKTIDKVISFKRGIKDIGKVEKIFGISSSSKEPYCLINKDSFDKKPFGIVFIDEIDKILIKESSNPFYIPLQKFILTMIEGAIVTNEDDSSKKQEIDTSHITFILSGAFADCSPNDFIPELLGRLNIKVNLKKLNKDDYIEIIKKLKFNISRLLLDKIVIIEPSAQEEMANICEEQNKKEYLGARRIFEIFSKVNNAILQELQHFDVLQLNPKITVNADFVRWVFESEKLTRGANISNTSSSPIINFPKNVTSKNLKEASIEKAINKFNNLMVDKLVNKYKEIFKIGDCWTRNSYKIDIEDLVKRDSNGKSVFEYLVEKGVIEEIPGYILKRIQKKLNLDNKSLLRIKSKVKIIHPLHEPIL